MQQQQQPAYNPQYQYVPPGYAQVPHQHKHDFFIDIVVPYWPHVTATFAILVLLKLYGPLAFALLVTFKDWLFRDRKAASSTTTTAVFVGVGPDGRPVDLNTTLTKCLEHWGRSFFPADPNGNSSDSSVVDPNDAGNGTGGGGGAQRSPSGKKSSYPL